MTFINMGQPKGKKVENLNTEASKQKSTASVKHVKKETLDNSLKRVNRTALSEQGDHQHGPFIEEHDRGEINLDNFDPFVEYDQSTSCLGFTLLAICKNIQVNAMQAASLLSNSNKFLSQLIVKGKKNNFQPIINMMQDIFSNSAHLLKLMEKEETQGSVRFVLQAFKGAFHSNDLEVAKWGCRIYSKIIYDLANRDFLPDAWEW